MSSTIRPETVAAAARGNGTAVRQVIDGVKPLVVHRCRVVFGTKNTGHADRLAASICSEVVSALPAYASRPEKFLPFVTKSAGKRLDRERRKGGKDRVERSPFEDLIDTLPEGERDVLVLRILAGLSAEETATALGRTANVVRLDQHRAMKRLRASLATPADTGLPKAAGQNA